MNKARIAGLASILMGIIIQFTLENNNADFISGILIVGGIGLFFVVKNKYNLH